MVYVLVLANTDERQTAEAAIDHLPFCDFFANNGFFEVERQTEIIDQTTVCVTHIGAGADNAWEQRKLEAKKMLVNRAESPASTASHQDGEPSFFPENLWLAHSLTGMLLFGF